MIEPTIYISTCDKTKAVLKPAIMLMEKYWPKEKKVIILGYNGEGIELPKNYSFVSMKQAQESIESWAMDISSIIEKDAGEYVVFLLDDMLMIDSFNQTIFNLFLERMKNDSSIVRCDLGMDLQSMPCTEIAKWRNCLLVEKSKKANYWNTTQPSLWEKDYLVSVLRKSTNPWHFETAHEIPIGKKELGTRGEYCSPSMVETAISNFHPGKFNVMGLKWEDIKWLISTGVVSKDIMQWGMRKGINLPFEDFFFTMDKLKGIQDADKQDMYNHYNSRYGKVYQ